MSGVSEHRISWSALIILLILTGLVSAGYPPERPSVVSGQVVFTSSCAICHGEKGDGSGSAGAYDFTDYQKMRNENSTAFFLSITNGRQGTAMPPFGNRLSENQRWDVIAYIWTFWADRDSAGKGKIIYEKNCATCHGMKGDDAEISRVFNGKGAFDFTNLSTMANKHPSELFDGVTNGISGKAMPPWKDKLSESERWNVVKYAWTFQFKDYAIEVAGTPIPSPEIPAQSNSWYSTPGGAAIILISLAIAAAILYLFRKGMLER